MAQETKLRFALEQGEKANVLLELPKEKGELFLMVWNRKAREMGHAVDVQDANLGRIEEGYLWDVRIKETIMPLFDESKKEFDMYMKEIEKRYNEIGEKGFKSMAEKIFGKEPEAVKKEAEPIVPDRKEPEIKENAPVAEKAKTESAPTIPEHKRLLAEDGQFGKNTKAAVMDFQKQHGLAVDGVVGKNTWNKLMDERQKATGQAPVEYGGVMLGMSRDGKIGTVGEEARLIQQSLNAIDKKGKEPTPEIPTQAQPGMDDVLKGMAENWQPMELNAASPLANAQAAGANAIMDALKKSLSDNSGFGDINMKAVDKAGQKMTDLQKGAPGITKPPVGKGLGAP